MSSRRSAAVGHSGSKAKEYHVGLIGLEPINNFKNIMEELDMSGVSGHIFGVFGFSSFLRCTCSVELI